MILSSKPKPVNFRIVLNNAEITSIESLQKYFDFERFLVNDQMQLIRWLKWVDKKKGDQKGDRIETIVNYSREDVINNAVLPLIMSIIYEAGFNDMIQFVDFLYGHDNKDYTIAKNNFIQFISNHGDKLHDLFPIENIPRGNDNLDTFFSNLNSSTETSGYLSELYYRQGYFELSQKEYPHLWELNESERTTIKGITGGRQVIPSENPSFIGTEFIFLCAIAYLTMYHEDDTLHSLSDLIDKKTQYKPLRDRIGGSLKKLINEKDRDCYQICELLGYTNPHEKDPLFNEKLFLSSFFADDYMRDKLLSTIKKKNDYFPALFAIDSDRYESRILQSQQEVPYTWFRYILDYHDNPMGLDGDYDRDDNSVNEGSIIKYQYKENPSLMNEYFCHPSQLDPDEGDQCFRERIQRIKLSFYIKDNFFTKDYFKEFNWDYDHAPLKKKEKEYIDLFKEVVSICNGWNEYIDPSKGTFTPKAEKLIEKYKKKESALFKERLFVVSILILVKDHNKNRIHYIHDKDTTDKSLNRMYLEIKRLSKLYVPLRGLFKNQIRVLSENDKKILKLNNRSKGLNDYWIYEPLDLGRLSTRQYYYDQILRRWVANIVYYI